ncbi:MAG: type I DNA topoisomerase [Clostridiales bacterium]|nr:type I DNA topoisomerase [Clostridiales bacterium]
MTKNLTKNLIIVESPAKAKTIEKYLGTNNYKVIASMGHIRDLPRSRLGVDLENEFELTYTTMKGKNDIVKKIKAEAKKSKKILLATDSDREGEAISWHLAAILKLDKDEKCRIVFNEITKTTIKNAVKNPKKIDVNLFNAQQARRVLDRIVGYKLSPLLWKKIRKGLSAGRVQTVTMKMIIDKEKEIEKFQVSEYWTISAEITKFKEKKFFTANFYGKLNEKKMNLTNENTANEILKNITGNLCYVLNVNKSEKNKKASPPFITSTLQQESSRKLNFSAKKTMSIAQSLYEGIDVNKIQTGLITYMRTDSLRVSIEAQNEALKYIEENFGKEYIPKTPNVYKTKKTSQDAHESIRPTNINNTPDIIKGSLKTDQYKLYKLIWQRFLSSQMECAIFDTVKTDIVIDGYLFKSSGQTMIFDGFMKIYTEGTDVEEEKQEKIPNITEKENLNFKKATKKQHFTQPPSRFTEATLVKQLEKEEIGRPSTYAPTMSVIIDREYVIKEKKNLIPTELGKLVTMLIEENFKDIINIKFTANMESKLDEVEEGKKDWKEILKEFYESFKIDLKKAEEKIGKIEIEDKVSNIVCEKCGLMLVYKRSRYGKFLACPGYPDCKNAKAITEELGINCYKCGGKILIKKSKKGRKYFACENSSNCNFLTWDEPTDQICPKCGNVLLKKYTSKNTKTIKLSCHNKECKYHEEIVYATE